MDARTKEKLEYFLTKIVDPEGLAQSLRRFNFEAVKMLLNTENDDFVRKDWFADGHYYITELCEILDPQLEDKEK